MKRHFSGDYVHTPSRSGATVSTQDGLIKAEIIARILRGKAESLMTGTEALNIKNVQNLEYRFQIPEQDTIYLQNIQEGTRADYESISWFDIGGTLQKTQQSLHFTDEVSIRQLGNLQYEVQIDACANGFALGRDRNIFDRLDAAVGVTTAASGVWTDPIEQDVAGDLAGQIGQLLKTTTVTAAELPQIKVFYPVELHGYLKTPIQHGAIYEAIEDYVERKFRINFVPTKYYSNDVLMVLKGDRTAFHLFYTGNEIPTAESERDIGIGERYVFTNYFETVVLPDNKNTTTSSKIRKITGVI